MAIPVCLGAHGREIAALVVMHLQGNSKLADVLFFLANNEHAREYNMVLERFLNNYEEFSNLLQLLAKDIDYLEQDPAYPMAEIWKTVRPANAHRIERAQRFDFQLFLAKKERFETISVCMFLSIFTRLNVLPLEILSEFVSDLFVDLPVNLPLTEIIKMAQKLSGERWFVVTASFVYFVYDVWQNKNRWHSFEISGIRCIKNTVDSFVELGAGATGLWGGEYFGNAIANAKIVPLVGGLSTGLASTVLGGTLCDRFTQQVFKLPKDVSLENAFHLLNIPWTASNNDINSRYIRLAHRYYHDAEKWQKLNISFQRIIIS